MQAPELLDRLKAVRPSGAGWMASCPSHEDRRPSLSVAEGDAGDRIVLKCFAGCTAEAVVAAMGLSMTDLYHGSRTGSRGTQPPAQPTKASPPLSPLEVALVEQMHRALTREQRDLLIKQRCLSDEIIDRYNLGFTDRFHDRRVAIPIQDADGAYRDVRCWLPEVLRKDTDAPKIFHWEKGRGCARLFPIDQLMHDELLLVAGELDALAAVAAGFHAATATCSETSWPEALSESFTGKHVLILLYNDEAGKKGTEMRAQSLAQHQARVEIVAW